jgi:hypothetical protein
MHNRDSIAVAEWCLALIIRLATLTLLRVNDHRSTSVPLAAAVVGYHALVVTSGSKCLLRPAGGHWDACSRIIARPARHSLRVYDLLRRV